MDTANHDSNAVLKAKWTGTLHDPLYSNPLSITDIEGWNQESKLFPNPANDMLEIDLAPVYKANNTKIKHH